MQLVAIIVSLAVTAITIPVTVVAVRRMTAVIRAGGPAPGRTDDPAARTVNMLKETFLHTRMLQWSWIGALHWFVYLAFLVLATAVAQAFFQLFDPEFVWPIIGHFFLYEWISEAIGLLGALAIIPLAVYRQVKHPKRLQRQSRFFGSRMGQAYFVEFMVFLESAAILFIRGAEYNLLQARGGEDAEYATGFHFPIAQFFGNLYPTGAENIDTLENIIVVIAMIKVTSAMIWLLVISTNLTMGIAWHRFTAWPNIWFKRESDGGTALGGLEPIRINGKALDMEAMEDLEEEDFEKLGVGKVEDFSWKGLLDFTTCTECGRCQSQCPAWNTEKPLSPKLLVMGLREHAYAKIPALAIPEDERTEEQQKEVERPLIGDEEMYGVIDPDVLWSCTNCGACVQQCPVDIEHVDHIDDMRRFQVLVESNFPAELNNIFKGLERKGNPWGMNPKHRMDWAKDLDFEVKQVGVDVESLDEVEWLFWVGCAGAFEDRAKKTTQAVAELLNTAGVDFAVLGDGETCTGDPARRAGNEIVFMQLAMENAEVLKETKAKKVVSTCAHCFNSLKNEYAEFGVELEVVHHTQLLNRLVREGRLTPVAGKAGAAAAGPEKTITYHDPCFLGRHNQVYEAPRELLSVIPGAKFAEMPRNSERSFCCGAGGARMWMEENLGSRINVNRTQEAVATGADQIAVGCPFCRVMLSDGLTAQQAAGEAREEVEVLDVAQMLLAAVKRAPEPTAEESADVVDEAEAATAAAAAAGSSDQATDAEPDATDKADDASISDTEDAAPAADAHEEPEATDVPDDEPQDEPATTSREEDAEVAAKHNMDVDEKGRAADTSGDAGEAPGADEVDASTSSDGAPEPDPEPEPGDTTDPEVETVPNDGAGGDDSDDEATPATADEPAPAEDEPVDGDARDEEPDAAGDVQAKADTDGGESETEKDEPVQVDAPPQPAKPATDDKAEEGGDESKAETTSSSDGAPEPDPEPEPGDTTDPEVETVPNDGAGDDDEATPATADEPAPAEDEPVDGDAREEEADATDVEAKADTDGDSAGSTEAPSEVVAVEDAPNADPESDDVAPLSDANPSGTDVSTAATDAAKDEEAQGGDEPKA
ncbi:heterodisulfide reductase-related iron-sulfur binding cluster [Aeromicrobium sp. 50.2.37]|uniref:heterodisulfide reductase-related iron-sulfur binding cluster n=1 Tax=Aeromicrobium sp. 50.2.37 TaxID=2969305 RepID=UPI002150451C|nr:heterodisulfide reductase-related iron-sulfur binding cluster [Aeromicrobium sp. 50.2.37]MCR4513320.1 heterodisulfide reductase-related iron-sulfur binding cluster [Aeromicrobium sp. 50.2.37]